MSQPHDRTRSPPRRARRWAPTSDAQREAGADLFKRLLDLYASARLSAKDLAILCHLANAAGVQGAPFATYAVSPERQSGHQDHLDRVLPDSGRLIYVDTVVQKKGGAARTTRPAPVRVIWESIEEEIKQDATILN
eukprot:996191-Pyramimonas_sp.AAC.1